VTKIILYTTFALVAFAFNSVLCRLALRAEEIDAASFTSIRLLSGAVTLVLISYFFGKEKKPASGNWPSAFFLFAYTVCFSFAYISLTAGTGALVLFGSVQITMIAVTLARGEKPKMLEWLGLVTALGGLFYLVFPGLAAPPLASSALMAAAGISWGAYTLRGRSSSDPLAETTGNFIRSVPLGIIISIIFIPRFHLSNKGIVLAVISGAIASGIGYTVWYAVLRHHTATRAAVLQLAVPLLTAVIGVLFLAETAGIRLVVASALILGGIGLTILGRKR
jgi:drug/metabolite transporter (DMT)-like permease